ncbi:hypothetical protein WDU94_004282 [Cyamophila willieti]
MNTLPRKLKPNAIPSVNLVPASRKKKQCQSVHVEKRKSEEDQTFKRKIFANEIQHSLIQQDSSTSHISNNGNSVLIALEEKYQELGKQNSELLQKIDELNKLLKKEKTEKLKLSGKLEQAYQDIKLLESKITEPSDFETDGGYGGGSCPEQKHFGAVFWPPHFLTFK